MTYSSMLQAINVKEMGWWFAVSAHPPLLKAGVIHAFFHWDLTSPASINIWKNAMLAGVISVESA